MQWIIQFIVQHKNIFSLFLTVLISLWMLTSDSAKQQQITRALTLTVFFPIQFTVHQFTRTKNIFAENKKLREEVTTLTARCSELEQAAAENKRLRDLVGFEDQFTYTLLPAKAVVREPTTVFRSIVINIGQDHGVMRYMPVINKNGVIGKVVQVMPTISLVQLLRAPSERISVMVKRTHEVGIFETMNSKQFFIQYRKHADVVQGDTIITSGLGGIYPRGFQIGEVLSINNSDDPLFKDVFIKPSVDFEHIDEVFVMKFSPQWASFHSELDSIQFKQ